MACGNPRFMAGGARIWAARGGNQAEKARHDCAGGGMGGTRNAWEVPWDAWPVFSSAAPAPLSPRRKSEQMQWGARFWAARGGDAGRMREA